LKVMLDDKDATPDLDIESLLASIPTVYKRPGGRGAHPLVASSVVKIITSLLNNSGNLCHAPGPNGLPGGYPVRVSSQGVEVVVPEGFTLEKCIVLNEEAQVFEGIEAINPDGSVIFTDNSCAVMKDLLGYDCKRLKLDECEERANELSARFAGYVDKYRK